MNLSTDQIIGIIIAVVVGLLLIIVISSIIKAKRNAKKELPKSILDVDIDGVEEFSDKTFEYGFEKEDTIVMKQVEETEKKDTKKTTAKKNSTKRTSTKKTTTKKK